MNMKKPIIGVMGPGENPTKQDLKNAYEIGKLIAENGWLLLTGGRNIGVMDAANRGAKEAGGQTIGILYRSDKNEASEYVDIPIVTGMGSARNNINVLTSDVVIACGLAAGTASEVALALKAKKPVILLTDNQEGKDFFKKLDEKNIQTADTPEKVIGWVKKFL